MTTRLADRDQIERGFRRLTTEQRSMLVLHYFVGMPVPEVADLFGIPLGTAQSRIHRAVEALRAAIAADERAPSTLRRGQIV